MNRLDAARLEAAAGEAHAQTVAQLHAQAELAIGHHQRKVELITAAVGRPRFLYGVIVLSALWILANIVCRILGIPPLDPAPFFWLQGVIGLLALLVTSMVLITQNRQVRMAERRALLDLHINLLAEQKIAKLIGLIEELRSDLPSVIDRHDAQAEAMAQPLDAHAVVATLDRTIEEEMKKQSDEGLGASEP